MMSLLRLTLLGPPEVFHDEHRLTFSLRKAQALLLYLATEKACTLAASLRPFCGPIVLLVQPCPTRLRCYAAGWPILPQLGPAICSINRIYWAWTHRPGWMWT